MRSLPALTDDGRVKTFGELIPRRYRRKGLSSSELAAAQEQTETVFPDDLCELLTTTLPTGKAFPDWRHHPRSAMDEWRDWIVRGFQFALTDDYWPPEWGERPTEPHEARTAVAQLLADVPAMIPIFAHRAIPNEPTDAGNPVFSIMGTDIIVYGDDLGDYLLNEFHRRGGRDEKLASNARSIRFWTNVMDYYPEEYD